MKGGAAFPVRIEFREVGKVRWISHRDLARAFERAFRIVEVPLAFTEGFSPHPKISFGLALSTGHESTAEYLDVVLRVPVDLDELVRSVSEALPAGIDVTGAAVLAERAPALQESVTTTGWDVWITRDDDLPIETSTLRRAVCDLLAADVVEVHKRRKGREGIENIRPLIRIVDLVDATKTHTHTDIHTDAPPGAEHAPAQLRMELAANPKASKPADVLAALTSVCPDLGALVEALVVRTHQWIERDGERVAPLVADARPLAALAAAS